MPRNCPRRSGHVFQLPDHHGASGSFDARSVCAGQRVSLLQTAQVSVDCPDTHPFMGVGGQAIERIQTGTQHETPRRGRDQENCTVVLVARVTRGPLPRNTLYVFAFAFRNRPNSASHYSFVTKPACDDMDSLPVPDEVIDLFERLELIYREHRGRDTAVPVVPDRECGTTGITGGLTEA
jgi:hypothetical protein